MNDAPDDAQRYPTLSSDGKAMIDFMREHPHAPIYRNESGNRLSHADLESLRQLEREALDAPIDWQPGSPPSWVSGFVRRCLDTVPAYRRYGSPTAAIDGLPCIDRGDLARDVAQYVPDDVDVGRLINFRTSGTTGHPLLIASDPLVAAQYLGYHRRALRLAGIELRHGRGQVGVVLLGMQSRCFTYVSVTPSREESGLAKINLHPADWRHPDDRARYLDALAPEIIAGDPISLAEFLRLEVSFKPRALLSTSMCLMPGLRQRLGDRFGCPVLDLYSLNEAGPVAVDTGTGEHVLLQHRLYVEILDADGAPVPAGQRGEVTLTGGFNFCLPLLRYRTGDQAALVKRGSELLLTGLAGRPAVRFRKSSGEWINNIEVTHAMRGLALVQFALHQDANGDIRFIYQGATVPASQVTDALQAVFGTNQRLDVEGPRDFDAKVVQYTSALEGSSP